MIKIYTVIVTYNAMKWVKKCFMSLRHSSIALKCIVVDNGSSDGTQEYIMKNFPEVDFIQSTENLGFGKANNIGIEKAYKEGADFFYLMNQDAWLYPDTLKNLLQVYQTHFNPEEVGILSPMHIDGSEKYLDIFLDKYIAQNCEKTRIISDLYFHTLKPYYQINFINAAHWFLSKNTIEKVGGFNPYFFHYGEDNEYVNRLQYHKKKILLVPSSMAVHDGIQLLDKIDYNKYKDLRIETNIINPNLPNALVLEKKSLKQSILKSLITGNFNGYKKLLQKYRKISAEERKLIDIRNQVKQSGPTFLNL